MYTNREKYDSNIFFVKWRSSHRVSVLDPMARTFRPNKRKIHINITPREKLFTKTIGFQHETSYLKDIISQTRKSYNGYS